MKTCPSCTSYYEDMVTICDALWEEDVLPPRDFRYHWHERVAQAKRPPRKIRPSTLIPAVACCVVAVFAVSTAVLNPQAFGLGGERLSSEQFSVTPALEVQAEGEAMNRSVKNAPAAPIVWSAPSAAPSKAATAADYSEQTTWSESASRGYELEGNVDEACASDGSSVTVPEDKAITVKPAGERAQIAVRASEIESLKKLASDIGSITVRATAEGVEFDGPADKISLVFSTYGYQPPAGASSVLAVASDNAQ